jgi:hypothetical protein
MGEKDKCEKEMAKAKIADKNYKEARAALREENKEATRLCRRADDTCDPEKFEGKTGERLKRIIARCRAAQESCTFQETKVTQAASNFDFYEAEFHESQDALKKCEHEKKSGKK